MDEIIQGRLEVLYPGGDCEDACAACGAAIKPGEGLTARYADETLRFGCSACASRYDANPGSVLTGEACDGCVGGEVIIAISEWSLY